MIRMSRMADYAVVVMTHIAQHPERVQTATGIAAATGLSTATVSKILKLQAQGGLLDSHRGAKGGYGLAANPGKISVRRIVSAVDGPIALTDCAQELDNSCTLEALCPTSSAWKKINAAITHALDGMSLADLILPPPAWAAAPARPVSSNAPGPREVA